MAADHTLAWAYVEDAFAEEDDVIAQARYEAGEYGIASLSAATCAFLRQLARIAGAKSAVEVGTGTGVSGMYLLSVPGLSLTSIDVESEAQHCAREFFAAAGSASSTGAASTFCPAWPPTPTISSCWTAIPWRLPATPRRP